MTARVGRTMTDTVDQPTCEDLFIAVARCEVALLVAEQVLPQRQFKTAQRHAHRNTCVQGGGTHNNNTGRGGAGQGGALAVLVRVTSPALGTGGVAGGRAGGRVCTGAGGRAGGRHVLMAATASSNVRSWPRILFMYAVGLS
jgi:hypothetical protein